MAADAECIRLEGSLALVNGTRGYTFSQITTTLTTVSSVIAVRSIKNGATPIDFRNYEWFKQYYLNNGLTGTPLRCAQLGQGVSGTLVFNPTPNAALTLSLDCVYLPNALVDDTTVEAIPSLWTDAIPFYAAWLALQSLQRQADANAMLERYQLLIRRGRQLATPSELPDNQPGGAGTQMASAHQTLAQVATAGGRGGR